jgi:hypothetical protein
VGLWRGLADVGSLASPVCRLFYRTLPPQQKLDALLPLHDDAVEPIIVRPGGEHFIRMREAPSPRHRRLCCGPASRAHCLPGLCPAGVQPFWSGDAKKGAEWVCQLCAPCCVKPWVQRSLRARRPHQTGHLHADPLAEVLQTVVQQLQLVLRTVHKPAGVLGHERIVVGRTQQAR